MNLTTDYVQRVFKELIEHKNWIDNDQKNKITQTLVDSYHSYEILALFKDSPEVQKDFISEEVIFKFVSTFSNEDVENKQIINNKIELLLCFKGVITPKLVSEVIIKLRDLLNTENSKTYREEKENLLNCIGDVLDTLHKEVQKIPDQNTLNSFADRVIQGMNALGNTSQKKIFVFTCYRLVDVLKDPKRSEINGLITNFFSSADVESIKFVFVKLDKKAKEELIQKHEEVFRKPAIQQQPIFDLLYPSAPKDIRTQWFLSLISSAPQRALIKLDEVQYKVDDKVAIVDALLKRASQAPIQEKEKLYNAIHEMKCANDANLRNTLALQIKALIKDADPNQQGLGYNTLQNATYLSETTKRDIAGETIEWLRSLQPESANQPYSTKAILLNWKILPQTPQRDFVHFVFDKLIKRGNVDDIKLGFETLSQIKPSYENYYKYFEDVLVQAESEADTQIKSELFNGLSTLKPKRTNKRNISFWVKIDDFFGHRH